MSEIDLQVQKLEAQLKEVEDEIKDSYQCMKQQNFNLHAILIHQGSGEGGHYYAFIFDRKADKWYRFNDFRVTEESEERVLEEAFGDEKTKTSAYGLIYLNSELTQSVDKSTFIEYNRSLEELIPVEFVNNIKTNNYKFTKELMNFKLEKLA